MHTIYPIVYAMQSVIAATETHQSTEYNTQNRKQYLDRVVFVFFFVRWQFGGSGNPHPTDLWWQQTRELYGRLWLADIQICSA